MIRFVPMLMSAFALVTLGGCQAASGPTDTPLTGSWGGQHIALELNSDGGTLEYDCAAGVISEPVRPDAAGRFSVRGAHTPGHGGPARQGEVTPALPAAYDGQVQGGRMTLRVRIASSETPMGPFTLERGAAPLLVRCL